MKLCSSHVYTEQWYLEQCTGHFVITAIVARDLIFEEVHKPNAERMLVRHSKKIIAVKQWQILVRADSNEGSMPRRK